MKGGVDIRSKLFMMVVLSMYYRLLKSPDVLLHDPSIITSYYDFAFGDFCEFVDLIHVAMVVKY